MTDNIVAARGPTSPSVADITTSRKSGRSTDRVSDASASATSASRLRSWNSSKTIAATPSRDGSRCKRRTSTPSVTTSTRVDADTLDSNLTLYPTVLPRGSLSMDAMRVAAARAASRLGSSTMTFPSLGSQAGLERIMARGSAVVLPAPGGA